jgi:peptidoglycan/LPS O-acetylase OafA/YrhL
MLGVSPQAGFYLMPFRIFELAAGAAMVWLVDRQPNDSRVHELLVVMGVVLVLYPVFVYTNATPFPGTNALPTVAGTALLIYSGSARYAGRILNNPVAVGVGLVSYSLYLVHWPIIVFYRYWKFDDLGPNDQVGIVRPLWGSRYSCISGSRCPSVVRKLDRSTSRTRTRRVRPHPNDSSSHALPSRVAWRASARMLFSQ